MSGGVAEPPASGWRPLAWGATLSLLIAAAACRWLAFPPAELPIASIGWLALLAFAAVRADSPRQLAAMAFAVDLAWWLLVQRWIVEVSAAGYPALCAYLALWGVLPPLLIRRLAGRPIWAVLPLVVVAVDFLRGEIVLGGYPWYEAGQSLAAWSVPAQSADLLGARGLTLVVAFASGVAVELLRPRPRRTLAALRLLPPLLTLVVLLAAYGHWRLGQAAALPAMGRFLAVQTNQPIDRKIAWTPQRQVDDLESFARLTIEAAEAAGPPLSLVAWPETMLPGFGLEPETLEVLEGSGYFPGRLFAEFAESLRRRVEAPLLLGSAVCVGLRLEPQAWAWERRHNSVYVLTEPDLVERRRAPPRYDKLVLTPFGETMPLISRWKWLEEQLLAFGARGMAFDLSPGAGPVRFALGEGGSEIRVATPICFEATVASLCRTLAYERGGKAADLFVNASNDAWLGSDDAARRMHLRLASLRSIENRVPMLRAVNTGCSAAIDSSGRILALAAPARPGERSGGAFGARRSGWVVAELPRDDRVPLAARLGDRWAWLAVAAAAWMLLRSWRPRPIPGGVASLRKSSSRGREAAARGGS